MKQRRFISMSAAIVMLVTMSAIALPATAAEDQAVYDAYAAVVEDAASGAEALDALVKGSTATAGELQEAAAGVTLKALSYPEFPRYAHKAAYAAAGYAGADYTIAAPEDWKAMMVDADASESTNSAGTPNYFKGLTFHLTKDVDFKDAGTLGMMGEGKVFSGNINGHGYGFDHFTFTYTLEKDTVDYKVGMIQIFEGIMQDFGLNSGSMTGSVEGGNREIEMGMIGGFSSGNGSGHETAAKILRVWNHAAMTTNGRASNGTGALAAYHTQDLDAVINGFYTTGVLRNTAENPRLVSGLLSGNSRGALVYNVISDTEAGHLLCYGNEATVSSAVVKNVFATGVDNFYASYSYTPYSNSLNAGASKVESALEAAWRINSNPINDIDPVYFTIKNGKLHPVATNEKAIIRLALNGYKEMNLFIVRGEETTVASIAEALGVDASRILSLAVTQGSENIPVNDGKFTVTGDATVTVNIQKNETELLAEVLEKYAHLNSTYFAPAAEGMVSLAEFRAAAAKVATNELTAAEVMAMEAKLDLRITDVYTNLPAFSEYDVYAPYNEGNHWAIKTAADWNAMNEAANTSSTAEYFKGYTFHLTNDVDFGYASMLALGNKAGKYFAGTIDGHGYGFNEIYIPRDDTVYTGDSHITNGLIKRLGDCVIKNFGVNSGLIQQNSSNNRGVVSTFGRVDPDRAPEFSCVWSGAWIYSSGNASVSALVGVYDNGDDGGLKVNGFYFDGALIKAKEKNYQFGAGILGGYNSAPADGNNYYNIISDPDVFNVSSLSVSGSGVTYEVSKNLELVSALLKFSSESAYEAAVIENVYGIKREGGIQHGYIAVKSGVGGVGKKSAELLTEMTALEAAWTINNHPTENPVYFTLKGDKIRPTSDATHKIIKVTLTGDFPGVYYANAHTAMDLADLFGYKSELHKATFTSGEGAHLEGETLYFGDGDVTLDIEIICQHEQGYTYTAENGVHIERCAKSCGYQVEERCSAESYTVVELTLEEMINGASATHSGVCAECGEAFTQICVGGYKPSAMQGVDSGWYYNDCPCGRENVLHEGSAPVIIGDIDGDKGVGLVDAIEILNAAVGLKKINLIKADATGDQAITALDAIMAVRIWLGDADVVAAVREMQNRFNVGNYMDHGYTLDKALDFSGNMMNLAGSVVTGAIPVRKGEKVVFGPVRLGQPVLGYAYDADMNPMALINYTNVKTRLTLKQGMVVAEYTVPAGAAYVRLRLTEAEMNNFVVRINCAMTMAEFEARAYIEADDIINPLKDLDVLTVGDSICAAARDSAVNGLKGWARRIYQTYDAKVINSGVSGAALSNCRLDKEGATEYHQISNQIARHRGNVEFEYILLHGGVNDAWDNTEVGTMSNSFDPATFDINTYAGGLELAIYTAIKDHGNTAAIGYLINFESPNHNKSSDSGKYFEVGRKICDKWGIKYLDLYNNVEFDTTVYTADMIHPNEAGYDVLGPYITEFMTEMRPVSYEIWSAVQETID